jgi:hypothetical protein
MERRIKRLLSQVRMAIRGWKPGQLWKGSAGPRCQATTNAGTACPSPTYVNGYCGRHGGGPGRRRAGAR